MSLASEHKVRKEQIKPEADGVHWRYTRKLPVRHPLSRDPRIHNLSIKFPHFPEAYANRNRCRRTVPPIYRPNGIGRLQIPSSVQPVRESGLEEHGTLRFGSGTRVCERNRILNQKSQPKTGYARKRERSCWPCLPRARPSPVICGGRENKGRTDSPSQLPPVQMRPLNFSTVSSSA